ncbi:MAG: hypothetical protein WCS42_14800 [Verrucomicrobiota bacterium]
MIKKLTFFAAVMVFIGISMAPAETIKVSVNPAQVVCSNFMGLGVQWDPFDWYQPSTEQWNLITNRMDFCRPGYLRVMWSASAFCLGFDTNGQPQYVWAEGSAEQKKVFERLTAILDFAQARNIPVIYGEWAPPSQLVPDQTDPRWARCIACGVHYLIRQRGYKCIRFYNLINEPNGSWSHNKDYPSWVESIRNLKQEFDTRGLSEEVRIIGPDTTGNTYWLEPFHWLERSAGDLPDCLGAWDLHWYASDEEVISGNIERLLLDKRASLIATNPRARTQPAFLAESGLLDGKIERLDQQPRVRTFEYGVMMADYAAQVARAGWQGTLAWDMDDAMHIPNWKHALKIPDGTTFKVWGFWNSYGDKMGRPGEMQMRPWFYTWSLMSRLFSAGTRMIKTDVDSATKFRAIIGMVNVFGREQMTVMLVNNANTNRLVRLQIPSATPIQTMACYHYFENDRPVDDRGFPKPKKFLNDVDLKRGIELMMPSRGVIFLTTLPAS